MLPTWMIYVVPAVMLAVAFVLVLRRELRRAAEARSMAATVYRLDVEDHKKARHRTNRSGGAQ